MTQVQKHLLSAVILLALITGNASAYAQDWKSEKRINVLFGLAQPVLAKGFNIEGNYIYHRFIFDYSHGASLDFSGKLVPTDLRKQHIAIHEPFTTGFGIGYRVKEWINVRVEPKWHRFEFYYEGDAQNKSTEITAYNTFSLGLGVYGFYQPFKKKNNYLKGFTIAPSIRFWPTVSSDLKDDKFTYLNKQTGSFEEIKRVDPGTGFTPWVFNVSVGYSFKLKKEKLMAGTIKAIVFKTTALNATKDFFTTVLQFPIKETSAQHFVVHSKGIRLVFVKSNKDFEIALYLNEVPAQYANEMSPGTAGADFETCKDPNGITIVTVYKELSTKK